MSQFQASYRDLFLPEHGNINAAYPDRYRRLIVSGDESHTAMQLTLFYEQDADGVRLDDWVGQFIMITGPGIHRKSTSL